MTKGHYFDKCGFILTNVVLCYHEPNSKGSRNAKRKCAMAEVAKLTSEFTFTIPLKYRGEQRNEKSAGG